MVAVSVKRSIPIGIPVCVMTNGYFTRNSLYLIRLRIFERLKLLRRQLHQIQGNWAGEFTAYYAHKNANLNLTLVIGMTTEFIFQINNQFINGILGGTLDLTCVKSTTANGFTFRRPFQIINSLMGSWGLRLTGLDCKDSKLWLSAPHSLGSSYESLMLFLSVMTSFCYYNQHPSGFCFFVQMKAFLSKPLLGLPNINKKGKTNLKWAPDSGRSRKVTPSCSHGLF